MNVGFPRTLLDGGVTLTGFKLSLLLFILHLCLSTMFMWAGLPIDCEVGGNM
jgi:hypothetical protein